ncbi:MAG: acyl-CoA dehydrogenase [Acidimicrobiia bacterium]
MELDFTTEQEELREAVRRFLTAECPIDSVREIVEARVHGIPADTAPLHHAMTELGWAALTTPAHAGGLGLGTIELALVAEELGRAIAPGPLFATLSQFVPLVLELGTDHQVDAILGPVADGARAGTVAIAEKSGVTDPECTSTIATPTSDGYRLDGTKYLVFEPATDGLMIVIARTPDTTGGDGIGAFVVPVAETRAEPIDAMDPSRILATVGIDGVTVPADRVLGPPGPATAAAIRRSVETATVAVALDAVGAAQQVFDISLDYVKQREQFGVPVGSFQAIKHKFADMLMLLERARSLAYFAALTIADDDDRRALATAMAKSAAGDAVARIAKEAIQVHGGIGYTWESDVHLYVRRLQSDAVLFGNGDHHRQTVADLIGV